MRYILFIIMMIQGILCHAAICKHVSGGTETDNRSVLKIQKDLCGYMWFLTYDGINRYDGTHLKRYDLNWGNDSVRSCLYSYNVRIVRMNCGCLAKMGIYGYTIVSAIGLKSTLI